MEFDNVWQVLRELILFSAQLGISDLDEHSIFSQICHTSWVKLSIYLYCI